MDSYSSELEQQMQGFYHSLSEKDRRRYAASEAVKLVVCQEVIDGYSRFNLIRASSVVNCQSALEEI